MPRQFGMSAFHPKPTVRFRPIADIDGGCHCSRMLIVPRLIIAASFGFFLVACAYVGHMNEQLKSVVTDGHRAVLLIGFTLGAAAVSKHIMLAALARHGRLLNRPKR